MFRPVKWYGEVPRTSSVPRRATKPGGSSRCEAHGPTEPLVRYRLGLCAEALGRWQDACDALAPLAERRELNRPVIAARLAQTRCLLRLGRLDDIKQK